ncbi:MAG: purine-binding chemotaxis protein CheW [Spartobacteria bacterium]|nr:purine-binding chemotaxis protein CheW [Spartobacteria bacterium]
MPLPDETSPAVSRPKDALAAINHELLQREELAGRYLSFFLDQEEYGIEIVRVQEIIRMTEITRIPRAPDFIRGLINLRGQVVAVIDLRARFGLPFIEPTEHTCIIVVNIELKTGHAAMGLVVDAVSEVLQIGADQIESADTLSANLDSHYLLGMAIVAEKVIILLDVDSVLAIVDGIGGEAAGGAV